MNRGLAIPLMLIAGPALAHPDHSGSLVAFAQLPGSVQGLCLLALCLSCAWLCRRGAKGAGD